MPDICKEEESPLFILTTETGLVFIGSASSYEFKPATDDFLFPARYSVQVCFRCATKSTIKQTVLDTGISERTGWFAQVRAWAEEALSDKKVVSYQ